MDPSLALNTLMSSGLPSPGFSPPAVVPKIHPMGQPRIGRPLYGPAKSRRLFRMLVSMLSHYAFLRTLAYDMRWSVRCRRWNPMIRSRRLWCAVSSAECPGRESKSHPYSRVSITSTFSRRIFRVNGGSSIYRLTMLKPPSLYFLPLMKNRPSLTDHTTICVTLARSTAARFCPPQKRFIDSAHILINPVDPGTS